MTNETRRRNTPPKGAPSMPHDGRDEEPPWANQARLVGRLAAEPITRTMPSGDELVAFRVVVERTSGTQRTRQRVDALECVAWTARMRGRVSKWNPGDLVEVVGPVRRRFFRVGLAAQSRVEIEATGGRLIRRRPAA